MRSAQWVDSNGDDSYKVSCSLRLIAYYGADPHHMADVLDGVLDAGDQPDRLSTSITRLMAAT